MGEPVSQARYLVRGKYSRLGAVSTEGTSAEARLRSNIGCAKRTRSHVGSHQRSAGAPIVAWRVSGLDGGPALRW